MIHTLESWDIHWTRTSKAWDTVGYNNYKFWDTLYLQDWNTLLDINFVLRCVAHLQRAGSDAGGGGNIVAR